MTRSAAEIRAEIERLDAIIDSEPDLPKAFRAMLAAKTMSLLWALGDEPPSDRRNTDEAAT